MTTKDDKAASRLVHLAGAYIAREAGRSTLITVTRAEVGKAGKNALIYVSVFPDHEVDHAMEFLNRHKNSFKDYLKKEARFGFLPRITFMHDIGEANRRRMDELSKEV